LTLKKSPVTFKINKIFIIDISNQKFLFCFQNTKSNLIQIYLKKSSFFTQFRWDSKRKPIIGNTAKVGNCVCNTRYSRGKKQIYKVPNIYFSSILKTELWPKRDWANNIIKP